MFNSVLFVTYVVLVSICVCGQKSPYSVIKAGSYDYHKGVVKQAKPSLIVTKIAPGDILGFYNLDFSDGALAVQLYFTSNVFRRDNCRVLFRLDSATSAPFLAYYIEPTGSWDRWITATAFIPINQRPRGVHDLYFTFEPSSYKKDIIYIDWFTFYAVDGVCPTKNPPVIDCPTQPTTDCPETEQVTCPATSPVDCPTPEPVTCPDITVLPCETIASTTMSNCNCTKLQRNSSKTLKSSIITMLIVLFTFITFN